jgi:dihydrofolate reductase
MRKVILHMMLTRDWYASGPNGELDWIFELKDDERNKFVFDLYSSMDGAIVGRVTYRDMENHWPTAEKDALSNEKDRAFAGVMNNLTKYVFSKTLEKVEWSNSILVKGDVMEEVTKLKQQSGKNIVLCGGVGIAQTFMKLGLIDEYQLIVHPLDLGKGKRLFESQEDRLKLKLLDTKKFQSGIAALHYGKSE